MKNIYQKLLSVMSKIERVEKRGYNSFHKYEYVMEADLIEACKKYLVEEGLVIINNVEDVRQEGELTTVNVEYMIVNVDNPEERLTLKGSGQGQDKGDKGIYKALTGSMKYFLMKNLLIATGDDPELDSPHDKVPTKPAKLPPKTLSKEDKVYADLKGKILVENDLGELERKKAALLDKPDVVTPTQHKDLIALIDRKLGKVSAKDAKQDARNSAEIDTVAEPTIEI